LKEEVQMAKQQQQQQQQKKHEMLNIPGHTGNGNQNHIKIPPHFC
jgi:hypothetical protein